jgi:diadenosine tetraphosphate (Ap4A) HIT family hydrolase
MILLAFIFSLSITANALSELETVSLSIPSRSLSHQSLQVGPISLKKMADPSQETEKVYALIQKTCALWKEEGVDQFLLFARLEKDQESFYWEIVPYDSHKWDSLQQLTIFFRVIFGGSSFPSFQCERESFIQKVNSKKDTISSSVETPCKIFCNKEICEKQRVLKGKKIAALYDQKPLIAGNHLLLISENHRSNFTELSQEEWQEQDLFISKIFNQLCCGREGSLYLYAKAGEKAGQTVFHHHMHCLFVPKEQDLGVKIKFFLSMLGFKLGSSASWEKERGLLQQQFSFENSQEMVN